MQDRFDRFSKGGGFWPPLKPATIRRRRKQSSTILRDTGTLMNTLTPEFIGRSIGQYQKVDREGIVVGIVGGKAKQPRRKRRKPKKPKNIQEARKYSLLDEAERQARPSRRRSLPTLGELAAIHHFGKGNVPVRTILDLPSNHTMQLMEDAMMKALDRLAQTHDQRKI